MDKVLVEAYHQTCYHVEVDGVMFALFIEQPNFEFECYCHKENVHQWAIITAYNPYSNLVPEALNLQANMELEKELQTLGYVFYRGDGVPNNGSDWLIEKGFWIPNIDVETSKKLAKKYQQNAIVIGSSNTLPQLYFIE